MDITLTPTQAVRVKKLIWKYKTEPYLYEPLKSKDTETSVSCSLDEENISSESPGISRNENMEDWLVFQFITYIEHRFYF